MELKHFKLITDANAETTTAQPEVPDPDVCFCSLKKCTHFYILGPVFDERGEKLNPKNTVPTIEHKGITVQISRSNWFAKT